MYSPYSDMNIPDRFIPICSAAGSSRDRDQTKDSARSIPIKNAYVPWITFRCEMPNNAAWIITA